MKENKYRGRVHMLLLYPEDETHMAALKFIEQNYEYAYILHNRDNDESGEIKKEHFHVVVRFGNATWNTAVAKELGIEINYIQQARNIDNALMYLLHYNDKDKTQYDFEEVKGTLKQRLVQAINSANKNEGEKVGELLQYINEYRGKIYISDFANYCATNGYWSEFRRSATIFLKIIDEHNTRYNN